MILVIGRVRFRCSIRGPLSWLRVLRSRVRVERPRARRPTGSRHRDRLGRWRSRWRAWWLPGRNHVRSQVRSDRPRWPSLRLGAGRQPVQSSSLAAFTSPLSAAARSAVPILSNASSGSDRSKRVWATFVGRPLPRPALLPGKNRPLAERPFDRSSPLSDRFSRRSATC